MNDFLLRMYVIYTIRIDTINDWTMHQLNMGKEKTVTLLGKLLLYKAFKKF